MTLIYIQTTNENFIYHNETSAVDHFTGKLGQSTSTKINTTDQRHTFTSVTKNKNRWRSTQKTHRAAEKTNHIFNIECYTESSQKQSRYIII